MVVREAFPTSWGLQVQPAGSLIILFLTLPFSDEVHRPLSTGGDEYQLRVMRSSRN